MNGRRQSHSRDLVTQNSIPQEIARGGAASTVVATPTETDDATTATLMAQKQAFAEKVRQKLRQDNLQSEKL